jgi:hypothetical protein
MEGETTSAATHNYGKARLSTERSMEDLSGVGENQTARTTPQALPLLLKGQCKIKFLKGNSSILMTANQDAMESSHSNQI